MATAPAPTRRDRTLALHHALTRKLYPVSATDEEIELRVEEHDLAATEVRQIVAGALGLCPTRDRDILSDIAGEAL